MTARRTGSAPVDPWAVEGPTTALAGLYPFVAGQGAPTGGVPVGRHLFSHEPVGCDPFAWFEAGLVTNLGMMILGAPGAGKTVLAKRIVRGLAARGVTVLILGDPKGEYARLTRSAGGQVVRLGPGLDRINPLDAGRSTTTGDLPAAADRRLAALLALCSLVRPGGLADWESAVAAAALDVLTGCPGRTDPSGRADASGRADPSGRADASGGAGRAGGPTVSDVLDVLVSAPAPLVAAAQVPRSRFTAETLPLRRTLHALVTGPLRDLLDGPTSTVIDAAAPIVCLDLSAIGSSPLPMAAAMITTWLAGQAIIEGGVTPARGGPAPPRRFLAVLDEMWRALRGSPALVDHADALTRVYRHRSVAHLMVTHSLDDLAAVGGRSARAKTHGFLDRCAITALTATSGAELDEIAERRRLTRAERDLVRSWSSGASWSDGSGPDGGRPDAGRRHPGGPDAGRRHPGRGRYLLKAGDRIGLPIELTLVADEPVLYDTDPAPGPGAVRR